MKKEIISTKNAPEAIGPYSQAVKLGNMIYTSGMIPIVPKTGEVISNDVAQQARQAIKNLEEVLKAAGTNLDNVLKTTVFIKDMRDFAVINEVYKEFFKENYPARSCVEVARLPKDVLIEIECIAYI